jgi:hypothetical protein
MCRCRRRRISRWWSPRRQKRPGADAEPDGRAAEAIVAPGAVALGTGGAREGSEAGTAADAEERGAEEAVGLEKDQQMMRFQASKVHVPSREELRSGEGWVRFEWNDESSGWECLIIELDGFCSRRAPMSCGLGIEGIELSRDRINLRFWPTLAANLQMEREIEIGFDLEEGRFNDVLYAVEECVAVEPRDITDEEIRAEWVVELNRRIAEVDDNIVECIPAEEVHRSAQEMLERMKNQRTQ